MYFPATSEVFVQPKVTPQNGRRPFFLKSTYAVSKLAGLWTVRTYRNAYKLFMANGYFSIMNQRFEVQNSPQERYLVQLRRYVMELKSR